MRGKLSTDICMGVSDHTDIKALSMQNEGDQKLFTRITE
jgi:hypothetical protein